MAGHDVTKISSEDPHGTPARVEGLDFSSHRVGLLGLKEYAHRTQARLVPCDHENLHARDPPR